jgi:methylglutaconyl-CoA hydratase
VDPTLVDATVEAYLSALLRGAPRALSGTKQLLRRPKADTFRDDVAELTELSVGYFGSAEGIEGITAFRDKREPNWIPDGIG